MKPMKEIDLSQINRILVIKFRHVGDVLLSSATMKALKDAAPHVHISALVPSGTEDMLTLNPNVDEVIPYKKGSGIIRELSFLSFLRSRKYDAAINLTEGERGTILSFLSGAKYRIGFDHCWRRSRIRELLLTHRMKDVYDGRHRAAMDLALLAPFGIVGGKPVTELHTSETDDLFIDGLLEKNGLRPSSPFAVVHPTSRWMFKCWKQERMAAVIDYLENRGMRVFVTSGPDAVELGWVREMMQHVTSRPVNAGGMLSLKQLASLIKKSRFFLGVDSAPMHMAAALGTPVLALFGPSDSRTWRPLSDKGRIILKTAEFPCIPCKKDGCKGSKKSDCLEAVTVEEVVEAIGEMFRECGLIQYA